RDGRDDTSARELRDVPSARDGRDLYRDGRDDPSARERRDLYRDERGAEEPPPLAAERPGIDAVQEDEVSEIALDDDERAHVAKHYGLRAFGRAIARAVGKLLIPYPDRARRAALAEMPLQYLSFREARAAFKHREIDETSFQEAVWQLRERRRRKITVERDRYARGELNQSQYEAQMDRIWDEFWGRR
ncbi:MAG TPA: hypothetical protein VFN67_03700, partial [Polyangiales bacterium]|nr:hypothetical protein [Polyangiales bacterium]